MISEKLLAARKYESEKLPQVPSGILPVYHITGGVGWINDPNGFSRYKNEYHLFFQYNPYDVHWDTMHWGHVKTTDFIHWERLPCAMAPDEEFDKDGCFSGSAIELPDGRHLIMYTGVRKETLPGGKQEEYQAQCIAVGDGIEYKKLSQNPVIDAGMLPPGGSVHDFRDPKIFEKGGKYYAVAGNRCPDGSGAVLLFESGDALSWSFCSVLASSGNRHGRMWECPDFFTLDSKDVLLVSPQEMKAKDLEFIDGNITLCLVGSFNPVTGSLEREHEQTIDYGLDFYAPQTVLTADGRRVMIAWMQYWDSVGYTPEGLPFFGQMTFPRELKIHNGRLYQTPVIELESARRDKTEHRNVAVSSEISLPGIKGRVIDLMVNVLPGEYEYFRITVAADNTHGTEITYNPEKGTVLVDRSLSGSPKDILNTREFCVSKKEGKIEMRILLDRYSLELFVNGGSQAASFTIYTPLSADGISFSAGGTAVINAVKYNLEF